MTEQKALDILGRITEEWGERKVLEETLADQIRDAVMDKIIEEVKVEVKERIDFYSIADKVSNKLEQNGTLTKVIGNLMEKMEDEIVDYFVKEFSAEELIREIDEVDLTENLLY